MATTVQVVGALLVLAAFAAAQAGRWSTESTRYLVTNLVGAGILAASALVNAQWGFVLLNATWTAVAAAGLVAGVRRRRRGRPVTREHPPLPPT
ncbi:MAG: hypothetical protein KDB35_01255 [Acidimicrobiales bacterium]|nr:hypothetical protein [Acidimicrobiales bacterium]MCB1014568.1 hypothetical protein [Acidimicrobiales bacterium]MCB9373222.1 hypothetical protein [Microthrixaceae bacterium]